MPHLPPLLIFVGALSKAQVAITDLLQNRLCAKNFCKTCISCMRVMNRIHPQLYFHSLDTGYTVDTLEPLKQVVQFIPDPQPFFIILEGIDLLSISCANSLLKLLEEPPEGYYFLGTASVEANLLPTIRSRAIVEQLSDAVVLTFSIIDSFKTTPEKLEQELPETAHERELYLFNIITTVEQELLGLVRNALIDNNNVQYERCASFLELCKKLLVQLPTPGSERFVLRAIAMHAQLL